MSKDISRLNREIRLLEQNYGREAVKWAEDYIWISIDKFRLPPGYNYSTTKVLILIPEHYGYGQPYRGFFVTKELCHKLGKLPNHFDKFPYSNQDKKLIAELERKGWSYICLHQEYWNEQDTIFTFLTQAYTFLSDPFRNWNK